jgi:hypothetical protein
LGAVVELVSEDISLVARSGITAGATIEIRPCETNLYARLLTVHFQTQMTIVIEASDGNADHAQDLAHFLAHFALPYQRQLSSFELLPRPSPHLYIQCVRRQTETSHIDWMLQFERPVTWVQLPDRRDGSVRISLSREPLETQKACHDLFVVGLFGMNSGDDPDAEQKFNDIRQKFNVMEVTSPAPWTLATVTTLLNLPDGTRHLFCEIELAALTRSAISLVALASGRPAGISEQSEKEIQSVLRLHGKADWEMLLSLARLYDRDIGARWSPQKPAMVRTFASLLGVKKS